MSIRYSLPVCPVGRAHGIVQTGSTASVDVAAARRLGQCLRDLRGEEGGTGAYAPKTAESGDATLVPAKELFGSLRTLLCRFRRPCRAGIDASGGVSERVSERVFEPRPRRIGERAEIARGPAREDFAARRLGQDVFEDGAHDST